MGFSHPHAVIKTAGKNEIEDILKNGSINDEAASEAEGEEEPSALVSKNADKFFHPNGTVIIQGVF